MKNKKKVAADTEVLTFGGDLTVENIQQLYGTLQAALDNTRELSLTFTDVTAVDLSFVQLLCAAHRTAVRADKIMKVSSHRPEILKAAVRELGFVREEGCTLDIQGSCLWKEGWE